MITQVESNETLTSEEFFALCPALAADVGACLYVVLDRDELVAFKKSLTINSHGGITEHYSEIKSLLLYDVESINLHHAALTADSWLKSLIIEHN